MSKMNELNSLLASMDGRPSLHVNGDTHPTALLTVDFGQPTQRVDLSSADFESLSRTMRDAALELTRRRGEVRVQADLHRGVYWASVGN